jgi:hypothetical protein
MLWSEIKRWAKTHGYECIKDKEDNKYYWANLDQPEKSGVSSSVSKLARDIYNSITDNAWIDHQEEFKNNKDNPTFTVNDY